MIVYQVYKIYYNRESMRRNELRRNELQCPARRTLLIVGGRWKVPILFYLESGPRRFSELRRLLMPVTPRMLAQQLRQLEKSGLVRRKIYAQMPPKVEYSLTPVGRSLKPVVAAMCRWGSGRKCR